MISAFFQELNTQYLFNRKFRGTVINKLNRGAKNFEK
jgi:hypothetical protein